MNVTTASGDLIIDAGIVFQYWAGGDSLTAGANQTRLVHVTGASSNTMAMSSQAGADGTAMTWTYEHAYFDWGQVGASFNAASTTSANWYTSTAVKPYSIKAGATALTHVADDAACPASIDGANKWCHVDSTDRIYVQVTGGGNPGTLNINCSRSWIHSMFGFW
jgi:hypothetical protein